MRLKAAAALAVAVVIACGATTRSSPRDVQRASVRASPIHRQAAQPSPWAPGLQALVTAQTENRLLVAVLPGGRVVRAVTVAGDPSYVDAARGVIVVVSSGAGTVTLLDRASLRVIKVFHGFVSPHIPAISPDGDYAYVTDDRTGELAVIGIHSDKLTSRVFVGSGAHHLAFTPDERQVWVALSQAAQTITILTTVTATGSVDPGHPRVVGQLRPGFLAHDLLFTPGGERVWITSAAGSFVGVFSVSARRMLWQVPAGAGPQHIVFDHGSAYITSGYGSSIEQVNLYSGRVIRRANAPYGSFDLDTSGRYVVTTSLFRGTLAVYSRGLKLLGIRRLAPSTEDVTLSAR